jgi:hypothetical protein
VQTDSAGYKRVHDGDTYRPAQKLPRIPRHQPQAAARARHARPVHSVSFVKNVLEFGIQVNAADLVAHSSVQDSPAWGAANG